MTCRAQTAALRNPADLAKFNLEPDGSLGLAIAQPLTSPTAKASVSQLCHAFNYPRGLLRFSWLGPISTDSESGDRQGWGAWTGAEICVSRKLPGDAQEDSARPRFRAALFWRSFPTVALADRYPWAIGDLVAHAVPWRQRLQCEGQ